MKFPRRKPNRHKRYRQPPGYYQQVRDERHLSPGERLRSSSKPSQAASPDAQPGI